MQTSPVDPKKVVLYIAYDAKTYNLLKVSTIYDQDFNRTVKEPGVSWLNTSHPQNALQLAKVNAANSTAF